MELTCFDSPRKNINSTFFLWWFICNVFMPKTLILFFSFSMSRYIRCHLDQVRTKSPDCVFVRSHFSLLLVCMQIQLPGCEPRVSSVLSHTCAPPDVLVCTTQSHGHIHCEGKWSSQFTVSSRFPVLVIPSSSTSWGKVCVECFCHSARTHL